MKTLLAVLLLSGISLAQSLSNPGGASTNPTSGTIPVKSGSVFIDSPESVSGGNVTNTGTYTAAAYNLSTALAWCSSFFEAAANGSTFWNICAPSSLTVSQTMRLPNATPTSGGIMGWTSTTDVGFSGILNSNILIKGGGAGALPTNSLCTEDGTTLTCTDTGGIVAPKIVATGSGPGRVIMTQAADGGAEAANTATWQAPPAVTAYRADVPPANPVNNNSGFSCTNASPSICTFAKMQSVAFQTSAYTNATTTFSNATGLFFAVEASTNYAAECHVYWQGSATTAGIKAQFTGPASPTAVNIALHQPLTASTYNDAVATAFSSSLGVTTAITITTNFEAVITIGLLNGANAGTVQLQLAAEGVGTLTSNVGSYCKWQ